MSDEESFQDFRNWLIMQGKNRFYKTLDDPDSLAEIITNSNRYETICEGLASTASASLEQKIGEIMEKIEVASTTLKPSKTKEKELPKKFPNLAAILGECFE